jgi:thiamine-monophosphate kinase
MESIISNHTHEESSLIESLDQIGERELLNRLKKFMPDGQIDDDTAQLNPIGKEILVNTDVLVEGVHFSNKTTSAEDVGWRSIATNLSDLAASGVDQILGVTVGLIAPPSTTWAWVNGVYEGINKALNKFGGKLIGGDCSCGNQKILAITAIGTVGPLRLHRSNALAGDFLVASGPHGLSRLGLSLLLNDPLASKKEINTILQSQAIQIHQRPIPPLKALQALLTCKPKNIPWRAAGTDSSDGLLEALQNLCSSSNCQAVIDPKNLPRETNWPLGSHWDNWCLHGGEDFELVLSLPPSWAKALVNILPSSQIIGIMRTGSPKILWKNGKEVEKKHLLEFRHF